MNTARISNTVGLVGSVRRAVALAGLLAALAIAGLSAGKAAPAGAEPAAVSLCRDAYFGGVCQSFVTSTPDLRGSTLGNDTASSIRVPVGMSVALFADNNYTGACTTYTADDVWLGDEQIGNDTVSSVRVNASCMTPLTELEKLGLKRKQG